LTGGAGAIGKDIAVRCCEEGAVLCFSDLDKEEGDVGFFRSLLRLTIFFF